MAPSDKTALLEWLQQGATCSGTAPNGQDSGVVVVGGGGAPVVAGEASLTFRRLADCAQNTSP